MNEEDKREIELALINNAFEMLSKVELNDENRQLISQKFIELMEDEEERQPIDEDAN